jgi:undecaprenyl-diphosphatase
MSTLQAIILGLIQGITEFAPISSSGHLILVPWLFDWPILNDPALNKTFDVALHMGTLVGAVVYFWRDLLRYGRAVLVTLRTRRVSESDERIGWAILLATIPGVIVGALFEGTIESKLGDPVLISIWLAVMGVVLYVVDRVCRSDRHLDSVRPRTGLFLGAAQALALQPGVSRSGVTITAGRLIGLDRTTAARFSFLVALPIIFGAGMYEGLDLLQSGFQGYASEFFWGFVASAVSGFAVIWFLLRYLRTRTFFVFMVYRLVVAAVVIAVALGR